MKSPTNDQDTKAVVEAIQGVVQDALTLVDHPTDWGHFHPMFDCFGRSQLKQLLNTANSHYLSKSIKIICLIVWLDSQAVLDASDGCLLTCYHVFSGHIVSDMLTLHLSYISYTI